MDKAKRFCAFGGIVILFLLGFLILSHLGAWLERLKKMPDHVAVEAPPDAASEEQAFFDNLRLIEPPDPPKEAIDPMGMGTGEVNMGEEEVLIGEHGTSA